MVTERVFLKVYVDAILAIQARARAKTGNRKLILPLAIMTSNDTHVAIEELLKTNKNFGAADGQIILMKQQKVPALADGNGTIAVDGASVVSKPHGHGDVHSLLYQTGLASKWASEGKKWLLFFQDTNPLVFRVLPAMIGVSKKKDFVMNSLGVPRVAKEALGAISKLVSKDKTLTINVEYNVIDSLLKTTPIGGDINGPDGFSPYPGNINTLLMHIPTYSAELARTKGIMPEFVNPKYTDSTTTKFKSPTRLECMMQDFPRLLDKNQKASFLTGANFLNLDQGSEFSRGPGRSWTSPATAIALSTKHFKRRQKFADIL